MGDTGQVSTYINEVCQVTFLMMFLSLLDKEAAVQGLVKGVQGRAGTKWLWSKGGCLGCLEHSAGGGGWGPWRWSLPQALSQDAVRHGPHLSLWPLLLSEREK